MRTTAAVFLLLLCGTPTSSALATDAWSILEDARRERLARWGGVEGYMVDQTALGQRMVVLYDRVELDGDLAFLPVTPAEYAQEHGGAQAPLTPELLEQMAAGYRLFGDALATEMENATGVPTSVLGAGAEPWVSLDPREMFGGMAEFMEGAAEGRRRRLEEIARDPVEIEADRRLFAQTAQLVGTETVDGREAYHLRADGLSLTQEVDGDRFTFQAASMWIDTEHHVPLRILVEGVAGSGKKARPMAIERIDADYRVVPGTSMYEPYKVVMRLTGVLDAKQQRELDKARRELETLEQQLAAMPADQRALVEGMVGQQIETLRDMTSGGGIEVVTEVQQIEANPVIDEQWVRRLFE